MPAVLPAVAEQLFKDIQKIYSETAQIPDDLLIALKFVFGPSAVQALDLVDQRSVTCLSSPSGRKTFQVTGGSGTLYTCFASCHFCPCPAFAYKVLKRNESLLVRISRERQTRSFPDGSAYSTQECTRDIHHGPKFGLLRRQTVF
ncbi:zinc finger SWIM domain-containing protein 7 isoform X1 [Stigmatopora nigra]